VSDSTPSPPPAPPRMRVRPMLGPLAGVVAAALLATLLGVGLPAWLRGEDALGFWLYGLLLIGVLRSCRRAGVGLGTLVGPLPRSVHAWALAALAVPLLSISVATMPLVVSVLAWLAPDVLRGFSSAPDLLSSTSGIVQTVLLAPVVEELVFRGVMLRACAARWGMHGGVLASATAFAVLHFDSLGALAFGVVMALLYLRTRTLLVPMLCHALHNALIVLAEPWMSDDGTMIDIASAREQWWIGLLGVVGACVIFTAIVRRLRPDDGWEMPALGGGTP